MKAYLIIKSFGRHDLYEEVPVKVFLNEVKAESFADLKNSETGGLKDKWMRAERLPADLPCEPHQLFTLSYRVVEVPCDNE